MFKSLLLSLIFFVTSATSPVASKVDGALPGQLLYRIDRILEDMQLESTRTPEERAQLHLLFTQERLQETQALLEQGDAVNLGTALDGLSISLEELEEETLLADPNSDSGVIEIVDEVFDGPEYNPDTANQGFYCTNLTSYYHPVGYAIAQFYEVNYEEEVMSWYCSGYGLGEVKLAYQISEKTEYSVEELFGMRASGLGWGEIMHMPGRLEDTGLEETEEPQVTEEPEGTEEPQVTEEAVVPEDDFEGEGEGDYCTGADPHPTGENLAFEYGVTYDEIMTWFCQGYGFGEIRLAYNIAYTVGVEVEEVFGLRAGGMGWGQIMQNYDVTGNPKNPGNGSESEDEIPVEPTLDPGGKPGSTPGGKPDKNSPGKPENKGKP